MDKNTAELNRLRQTSNQKDTKLYRTAPFPTEGVEGEERLVEIAGIYYKYRKIDNNWRRYQYL